MVWPTAALSPDPKYLKRPSAAKRLLEAALIAPLRLLLGRGRALPAAGPQRVLLIRHNQLGDAVVCGPLIAAMQAQWPTAQIEVLASPANAPVFAWLPGVSQVWVRPPDSAWARWRQRLALRGRYDLVLQTLFDENYFRRALAARVMAGRGWLVGHARHTPMQRLLDQAVELPLAIYPAQLMALLTPLGAAPAPMLAAQWPRLRLHLPAEATAGARHKLLAAGLPPGQFVLLNLSAREANRALGDAQAAAIARALLAAGRVVLVIAAPAEAARQQAVAQAAPGAVSLRWEGLAEAMAAVGEAALYIGPDTGTMHFAAAAQVPCVVLFHHAVRAAVWTPYGVPCTVLQAQPGQAVPDINTDEAVRAALHRLGERVPAHGQAAAPAAKPGAVP